MEHSKTKRRCVHTLTLCECLVARFHVATCENNRKLALNQLVMWERKPKRLSWFYLNTINENQCDIEYASIVHLTQFILFRSFSSSQNARTEILELTSGK